MTRRAERDQRLYWRSTRELESLRRTASDEDTLGTPNGPESQTQLDEFAPGLSEPPKGLSRRTVLSLLGASVSLSGLAACRRPVEKIVPYVRAPEEIIPGVPRYYATSMPFGLDALGVVVESHEGRPTKIEGNELHPVSRGRSSAFAQASILDLYDPDRSQRVTHDGESAGWDELVAAWGEVEPGFVESGGTGLGLLLAPFSSPTQARLLRAFEERFPNAIIAAWEPVHDSHITNGLELATGTSLLPVYDFERAKVVLSLDADFLLLDSHAVHNAAGFAAARLTGDGTMNRLYAVEAVHSLTGANADHRLRLASHRIGTFVARLAAELIDLGLELGRPASGPDLSLEGVDPRFVEVVARDLMAHRGSSLLVAGRRQPPEVHAAVATLNAALSGSEATSDTSCVSYYSHEDGRLADVDSLRQLTEAAQDGQLEALFVLGANPAYDAPADIDIAGTFQQVPLTVHLGTQVDETGRLASWHVPQAHYLESWGDVRSLEGSPSVVQPLIAPLYDGKSSVELLGLLATGEDRAGYEQVQETWRQLLAPSLTATSEFDDELVSEGETAGFPGQWTPFERQWRRVLHDGVWSGGDVDPVVPEIVGDPIAALHRILDDAAPTADDLEVVFAASPSVFDGRFANNGWLQEVPDPLTKVTWDNAALVSPKTARELGLSNEDRVRLTVAGQSVELPLWTLPGQADNVVVLELGYGREVGRVATNTGVNVYALRTSQGADFVRGGKLQKIEGVHLISQTQDQGSMAGRPIVREASLDEYHEDPHFAAEAIEVPHDEALWHERPYDAGYQWGMTIDLNRCTGCNACVLACQSENNIPIVGKAQVREGREMHWIRIDRYFAGGIDDPEENPETVFHAVNCQHCENAPCEQVCPVAATVHDKEGLNVMVYNRCIGTRYCSNNCPYKVRRFNFFNFTKDTPQSVRLANNPDVTVRSRGVMEKCTYCTQRINAAKINAKLEGRMVTDGEIKTACQQACPSAAIEFGNILDPESRVAQSKAGDRNYKLLDELHTRPRTTYLAKLRNPNPELVG